MWTQQIQHGEMQCSQWPPSFDWHKASPHIKYLIIYPVANDSYGWYQLRELLVNHVHFYLDHIVRFPSVFTRKCTVAQFYSITFSQHFSRVHFSIQLRKIIPFICWAGLFYCLGGICTKVFCSNHASFQFFFISVRIQSVLGCCICHFMFSL